MESPEQLSFPKKPDCQFVIWFETHQNMEQIFWFPNNCNNNNSTGSVRMGEKWIILSAHVLGRSVGMQPAPKPELRAIICLFSSQKQIWTLSDFHWIKLVKVHIIPALHFLLISSLIQEGVDYFLVRAENMWISVCVAEGGGRERCKHYLLSVKILNIVKYAHFSMYFYHNIKSDFFSFHFRIEMLKHMRISQHTALQKTTFPYRNHSFW